MGMQNICAIILGGGQGTRLRPLTLYRTKPAVPIGGKYRLIDVPVSNCLVSGIGKIFIITQFNSQSLHAHITETYKFDYFQKNFIHIMAAEQSVTTTAWYQGTADAVRKNLVHLKAQTKENDLILILSGDQLYKMDFQSVIEQHISKKADVTICTKLVNRATAKACGIMKINKADRIIKFLEKPKDKEILDLFQLENGQFLASMGIYIFNRNVLLDLLENFNHDDFGKGIIPEALSIYKSYAYKFDGYWEDIGTIKSFYDANLSIAACESEFNFNHIFTRPRFLQPSKIGNCLTFHSMIAEGCVINSGKIVHSLVGLRAIIGEQCHIKDTIIMGADGYENAEELTVNKLKQIPRIGIGNHVSIERAIIDKNARIGNHVTIKSKENFEDYEGENFVIRDGIVIIPKSAVVPDHTVI